MPRTARSAKLSKREYEAGLTELRVELVNAQYELRDSGRSVLVIIGGDDGPGAAQLFQRLHEWLDARFLVARAYGPPDECEAGYPLFWRFWRDLPPRGRIGVWLGGWLQSQLRRRADGELDDDAFERALAWFRNFEAELAADGTIVLKLWIHCSRRAHAKRKKKAGKAGKGKGKWRLDEYDWRILDDYDAVAPIAKEIVRRTQQTVVVDGSHQRRRNMAVARAVLAAVTQAAEGRAQRGEAERRSDGEATAPRADESGAVQVARSERKSRAASQRRAKTIGWASGDHQGGRARRGEGERKRSSPLGAIDLSNAVPYDAYKKRLTKLQRRLFQLVDRAKARQLRTVIVLQGVDAAGKGGVVRRIVHAVDARDYRVVPIGPPSAEEQQYHYLWRFWRQLVPAGKMVIFDRSWYGRVLVERVDGLTPEASWRRAYDEINDFEEQLLAADSVLLKFWLHIDRDEQLRRFRARETTPYKKYKISQDDYHNRAKWDAYAEAADEMVLRTHTDAAPWHLVAANDKRSARVEVIDTVCEALRRATKSRG